MLTPPGLKTFPPRKRFLFQQNLGQKRLERPDHAASPAPPQDAPMTIANPMTRVEQVPNPDGQVEAEAREYG